MHEAATGKARLVKNKEFKAGVFSCMFKYAPALEIDAETVVVGLEV
jgi:hypothetical protein